MTPALNHTLAISRKGIERNYCMLHKQQKHRLEKACHSSGPRTKEQTHTKSSCLMFCFTDEPRMEQREAPVDCTEGRLRGLTSKWFLETQVPLIVQHGLFPAWFVGFITRKNAEEILREKEKGCFLIRLSDKAIGYILSYKGGDRCRHFVINQDASGQFVVCGDTRGHDFIPDLLEYYKTSPIQPFQEYLTSPCFEALDEEPYDVIQVCSREKPAVGDEKSHTPKQPQTEQPPTRPPKNNKMPEEVPPLPRRSRLVDMAFLNDQDRVLYAHLRKQSPREAPRRSQQHVCREDDLEGASISNSRGLDVSRCGSPDPPYSDLSPLDTKSRSLPLLDDSLDSSSAPQTPPRPPRQANSSCHTLEHTRDATALYHLAGRPGSPHKKTKAGMRSSLPEIPGDSVYAEVNMYMDTRQTQPENTYEPLEDIRPKHNHSTPGLKTDKWKWLFPDVKRKW